MVSPFFLKDCSLALLATGESAASLVEMRDVLMRIPTSSIYYHFWGARMRPAIVSAGFQNDFASWASATLHDYALAEKLGILDPSSFSTEEEMRLALLEIIDERLDNIDMILWSRKERKFHFLRSVIIVYDTHLIAETPSDLKKIIAHSPPSSFFYHFIDARKRTPKKTDDFTTWLEYFGSEFSGLINKIKEIDPYFSSLTELRQKFSEILIEFFP